MRLIIWFNWKLPSEFFSLGPFFALGLIMPHAEWTKLLLDKRAQMAGCLVFALWWGLLWNGEYLGFIKKHQDMFHWPLAPDASLALQPSRILEHIDWLTYKVVVTLAAIWSVA